MTDFFLKYKTLFLDNSDETEIMRNKHQLKNVFEDEYVKYSKPKNNDQLSNLIQNYDRRESENNNKREFNPRSEQRTHSFKNSNKIYDQYQIPNKIREMEPDNNYFTKAKANDIPQKKNHLAGKEFSSAKNLSNNGRRILSGNPLYSDYEESENSFRRKKAEENDLKTKLALERDVEQNKAIRRNENKFHSFQRNLNDINYANGRFHKHITLTGAYEKALQKRALAKSDIVSLF